MGPTTGRDTDRFAAACSGTRGDVAAESARARVHRADQHETRGEDRGSGRPRDGHRAFFERLTQHLEHVPAELEHLVEKQHAVVGEADFARDAAASRRR